MAWIRDHLSYPGNDCLIWPFSRTRDGYGGLTRDGKVQKAHRYICQLVHGAPPEPWFQATHSCGNGHLGCVNPKHLVWKTPAENQLDRGGRTYRYKLTSEEVAEIRLLHGKELSKIVAAKYSVTEANIRQIWNGKIWRTGKRQVGGFAVKLYRGGRPRAHSVHPAEGTKP